MNFGKIKRISGTFLSVVSLFGTPSIAAAQHSEAPDRGPHTEQAVAGPQLLVTHWIKDESGNRPRNPDKVQRAENLLKESYQLATDLYCEEEAARRVESQMDRDVSGSKRDRAKREAQAIHADLDREMSEFKNDRRIRRDVLDHFDGSPEEKQLQEDFAAWGFVVGSRAGADQATMQRVPALNNRIVSANVSAMNFVLRQNFDTRSLANFIEHHPVSLTPIVAAPAIERTPAPAAPSARPVGGYMGVSDIAQGALSQIPVSKEAVAAANHWTTNILNVAAAQGQIRPEQVNDNAFRHQFLDGAIAQQLPEGYQEAAGVAPALRIPQNGAAAAPTRPEDRVAVIAYMIVKNDANTVPYQNLSAADKAALEGLSSQVEAIATPSMGGL